MKKSIEDYRKLTENWQKLLLEKGDSYLKVLNYMDSGFTFSLSKEEYWKIIEKNETPPEHMHYYYGIEEGVFKIIMIDNESDKVLGSKSVDESLIMTKTLENSLFHNYYGGINTILKNWKKIIKDQEAAEGGYKESTRISALSALDRYMKWKLFGKEWLRDRLPVMKTEILKNKNFSYPLLRLPFADYQYFFEQKKVECVHHFFGLKSNDYNYGKRMNEDDIKSIKDYTIDIIVTAIFKDGGMFPKYFTDDSCMCYRTISDVDKYTLLPIQMKFDER